MKNIIIILTFWVSFSAPAQKNEHRNLENKLAIQGYDPVSYIEQKKAVKGKKELAVNVNGAIYYTSSEKNKELLKKDPAKYEPVYGGWCAFALGDYGEKVEINPTTFKIIGGKTHLFYNKFFNNTLSSWNKNEEKLKKSADQNWKKLTN
ncbi:YHS domain protein [Chryseobacterium elymi]|uniref:YHS domain protein n=1 Tax=Chryseobacterium elymi TaxID=395936 RepID=A0A3D9D7X4_9FLAO|nr:YHS domain-containing (seleno)protein [Chryseobacterium elymi]REC74057.1 YHS domain protein [Chryseobacterium elymi]